MAPGSAFTARHRGRTLLGVAVPRPVYRPALSWSQPPAQLAAAAGPALSNGDARDLHTTVDDTCTDCGPVSQTLHRAVGTSVTSEVPTAVLGPPATFPFHADEPPSASSADTHVATPTPPLPVVMPPDPVSANGTVVSPASALGQSPPMLWMTVSG
jgi:hypothetical protein